jgi:LuxR family transcriptional regulator, maltose regulon positive regulatory protein
MADRPQGSRASDRLPVLASKFGCPRLPRRAVARARLTEQMADPDGRVVLLTGGPASGKTVAAAQWFKSLDGTAREWLALAAEDGQPSRFWMTFVVGLNRAVPGAFVGTDDLVADPRTSTEAILRRLLTELSQLECDLVVVLDDVHVLRDPAIWRDLTALIEQLPYGIRLVLTSRVDPPIPVALWAARSWLGQIRHADLAFTLSETAELFAALDEHRLNPGEIEDLWRHTEGWAAALHLAASQIRRRADAAQAAQEFSGQQRMVADLLVTEVLDVQSDEIVEFMLQTCVLDTLDAEACDALTDRTDSAEVLRSLEAQMPFISAQDPEEKAYRYHPLLSDMLRYQLSARHAGAAQALALVAAGVLEQRGDYMGAVGHFIAAGNSEGASSLAFRVALDRYDRNDVSAAAQWVNLLRPAEGSTSVSSMLTYGSSLCFVDQADEGLVWFERAALRIARDPESYVHEAAILDALRLGAFTLMTGSGVAGAVDGIEPGRRVMAMVDDGVDLGYLGARTRPNLARAYLLVDRPDEAEGVLAQGPMGDEIAQLLLGPAVAARVALRLGDLTKAQDRANRALAAARTLGLEGQTGTLDAHLALAGVHTERNELGEADALFKVLKVITDGHPEALVYHVLARVDQVRLAAARGGPAEVFARIDEMRALVARRHAPVLGLLVDVIATRWHIEVGDLGCARDLLSRLPNDNQEHAILAARLDLASEHPDATLAALAREDFSDQRGRLACELLRARAAAAANDQAAETYAFRAAELAAPEGFIRLIFEEGPVVTRMVRTAADMLDTPAGLQLAVSLGAPPKIRRANGTKAVLSDRELDVLRFLPTQLSNHEIASECLMSVNTVKTHVKHIYSVLDASSRSVAVERARLLGFL